MIDNRQDQRWTMDFNGYCSCKDEARCSNSALRACTIFHMSAGFGWQGISGYRSRTKSSLPVTNKNGMSRLFKASAIGN